MFTLVSRIRKRFIRFNMCKPQKHTSYYRSLIIFFTLRPMYNFSTNDYRSEDRSHSVLIGDVQPCSVFDENSRQLAMSASHGQGERRRSFGVAGLDGGGVLGVLQQKLDDLYVPVHGGKVNRRVPEMFDNCF